MNIEHLRYLVTIADHQSISRASEQLLLKQQYLSTLVKSLEKQFGTQIFNRNYRGVTLTPNGQYLIDQMRPIVAASDRLMLSYLYPDNQHYCDDEVAIQFYTAPQISFYALSKIIHDFQMTFPHVTLTLSEYAESDMIEAVLKTPLSLAMLSTPLPPEEISQQLPKGIAFFFLRCKEMVAVTSSTNHQSQQQGSLSCRELLEKDLLIYTNSHIEDSAICKALAPYGEVNPKYVIKNAFLFWDILRNSNSYSLGDRSTAQREHLQAITLEEPLQMSAMLIANEHCLDSFICKSLINMFLLYYGHHTI